MNFLIDAHLPRHMAQWLCNAGHDALHTLDLPEGNRTTDAQLLLRADQDQRAIVTKDSDFVDAHLLRGQPPKLLLVSTGNISNRDLEQIFVPLIPTIVQEFQFHSFLELDKTGMSVRG